jgi:hypothetical protein
MTTELREISQIPARIKYLYAVITTTVYFPNAGFRTSSILTLNQFSDNFASDTISADSEMRDMGKSIVLVNENGQHYGLLRLVQTVNGPTTEGVPDNWDGDGQYYVFTWSSEPDIYNVTVARTG